jgi:hypothetical protein
MAVTPDSPSSHIAVPGSPRRRVSARVLEFRSSLFDLVVGVGCHGGGGHRLTALCRCPRGHHNSPSTWVSGRGIRSSTSKRRKPTPTAETSTKPSPRRAGSSTSSSTRGRWLVRRRDQRVGGDTALARRSRRRSSRRHCDRQARPNTDRAGCRGIRAAVVVAAGSACARSRRCRGLYAVPGSLPRHGENAWLRGAYRLGRGNAVTTAWPARMRQVRRVI